MSPCGGVTGRIPPGLRQYAKTCTFPYLHGVYLAVNAIPDLYLIVDAPNCAAFKSEQIYGTHDISSTLLDVEGRHRVINTGAHVGNLADGNHEPFIATYRRLARAEFVKAIAYTSFPMAAIIGTPYDLLVDEALEALDDATAAEVLRASIPIPGRSLAADWDAGYPDTLKALAGALELPEAALDDNKVALIGYFMDRNEEDHRGNLRELKRLIEALGLELVTTWLSGVGVDDLRRVAECETLIALPGGAPAARRLARRTGARLVETALPLGLEATHAFVRAIGDATGRQGAASALIEAESRDLLPKLKWLTLKRLMGTRWAYAGHPLYIAGLAELAALVGARLVSAVAWTSSEPELRFERPPPTPVRVSHAVDSVTYGEQLADALDTLDLYIGPSENGPEPPPLNFMEFGFPSWRHHALFDEPFLGYRGAACLIGRVADHLADRSYFID